jgi:two-component system, NtrC family, response regulator GlrR
LLVSHFLEQAADPKSEERIYLPKDIELLATTGWPENVRQLFDLVKQNVALTQADGAKDGSEPRVATFDEARERFSRQYLSENLRLTAGNVSQSARLAKRNRTDFYKLLTRYRLKPDDFKQSATPYSNHADS